MASIEGGGRVLVVDDDEDLRQAHMETLTLAGFTVTAASSADRALTMLDDPPHVVLSDIRMPGMDGLAFQRRVAEIDPELPVVLMTGHGDIEMAVAALHRGVFDFLPKPFGADRLIPVIRRALRQRSLVLENRRLTALLDRAEEEGARTGLIGQSPSIVHLREILPHVAGAEVDVLIEGESGVGKEVAARALHRLSRRRGKPFVVMNCAALPEAAFDAELFGRTATGAVFGRRSGGKAREADGGSLLLDEVEALTPSLQAKVLQLIETGQIAGEDGGSAPVDLRIFTTTRTDLAEAARCGAFRPDLYYRLGVVTLQMPPLRDRREDIPVLFRHLVSQAASRQRKPAPPVDDATEARLLTHDWPGNVRELAQRAERFVIGLDRLDPPAAADDRGLAERVAEFEGRLLDEAMKTAEGDVRVVMDRLGLPRKTFYDKVKRHGLDLNAYRRR